jgi:hypothetical protein
MQQQLFMEWTRASFEQSQVRLFTSLLEEDPQISLEMLEILVFKPDQSGSIYPNVAILLT